MHSTPRSLLRPRRCTLVALLASRFLPAAAAAATIQGTVLNQNTQRFLDRAIVQVQGTPHQALTAPDGTYRITGLPTGTHTVVANYTGLDEAPKTVRVTADETAKVDFELTAGNVYQMGEFVVTSAIEGNAYAVNQQRRAETIRSVTSVDAFLDSVTGSPGEFMKNLSGIQMDYNQNEPQVIRIRGMDPTWTIVTMDGNEIASTSDNSDNRRTMIDQLSMALISDVEVFKAPTPDRSANAIGGLVNFNTRSAFAQKGRRSSATVGVTMDSHDFHFRKTASPGHGDPDMRRVLPIGRFDFSDSFYQNRLGIVFGFGRDDTNQVGSSESSALTVTALPGQSLPPAGTPYTRNNVLIRRNTYTLSPNRQRRTRNDASLNFDFKLTHAIEVFLKTTYTDYKSTNRNHSFTLTPGTINPGFSITDYTTPNGTFAQGASVFQPKNTRSWQIAPGLKYRSASWQVDLGGGVSKSINKYKNPTTFTGVNAVGLGTVGYTLSTPTGSDRPAAIVINSGLNPYDINNYRVNPAGVPAAAVMQAGTFVSGGVVNPNDLLSNAGSFVNNNDRNSSQVRWSGRLDVRRNFQARFPFYLKAGLSYNLTEHERFNPATSWMWVGPDGLVGTPDDATTMAMFAERPNVGKSNLPGYTFPEPTYVDTHKIWNYLQANPKAFVFNEAAYRNNLALNSRGVNEKVSAAYLMGNARIDRLNVVAGVRVERTAVEAKGVRTLPTAGARDIRLTTPGLDPTMNVNSLPVVLAKYQRTVTHTDYTSDPFPYLHLRYEFIPGLQTRASYTEGIARPNFAQMLPIVTQNDVAPPGISTISSNNGDIGPSRSRNLDFSAEYYTKAAGEWSFAWFSRDVKDYISTSRAPITEAQLAQLGLDSSFASYDFITNENLGSAKTSGYELGVRQRLSNFSFLPKAVHGFEIWFNYTRIYEMEGTFGAAAAAILAGTAPKITALANTVPELYNGGISYRSPRGRFSAQLTTNFQEATPQGNVTATNQTMIQSDKYQFWNIEASYRLTPRLRLSGTGRNVMGERKTTSQIQGIVTNRQQDTGIAWVFSARYDL